MVCISERCGKHTVVAIVNGKLSDICKSDSTEQSTLVSNSIRSERPNVSKRRERCDLVDDENVVAACDGSDLGYDILSILRVNCENGKIVLVLGDKSAACAEEDGAEHTGVDPSTVCIVAAHTANAVGVLCDLLRHSHHLVECPLLVLNELIWAFETNLCDESVVEYEAVSTFIVENAHMTCREEKSSADGKVGASLLIPPFLCEVEIRLNVLAEKVIEIILDSVSRSVVHNGKNDLVGVKSSTLLCFKLALHFACCGRFVISDLNAVVFLNERVSVVNSIVDKLVVKLFGTDLLGSVSFAVFQTANEENDLLFSVAADRFDSVEKLTNCALFT